MISVSQLNVKYGTHSVLHNISFEVKSGDFLGIVGPNGSGKTSLVKTIVGLLSPASGKIIIDGKENGEMKSIGYLPQGTGFINARFPATAGEVVASGLLAGKRFPKWYTKDDWRKIDNALKLLQIDDLKQKQVGKLSGGQQQRVHLARALISNPDLLILDEPTGALDPNSRECFYKTLEHLNHEHKITVLIVSHDSQSIGKYIRTILFLDRRILFYGSIEEFNNTSSLVHYFGNCEGHEDLRHD